MATTPSWLGERGKPTRPQLALTVGIGEAAGILLVLQTGLLVRVVDSVLIRHVPLASLIPVFAGLLGVILLRALATWASKRSAYRVASSVKQNLRAACVERLREIGPLGLAGMSAGEVAHTAVDAVEGLDAYYSKYLPQRAIASLLPFTILAVVFPLDWISGLILVLTAVFLPLSMIVIGEESHERNRKLWGKLAHMSGRFLDVLQGITTVRMFDAARREAREIERASEEYRVLTLSVLRIAFLSSFMLELISAVSIAIVAVVSGIRLLAGSMSYGPAYFILLIAPEYFLTLRTLGTFYHARMEAVSAAEQVKTFLETPVASLAPRVPVGAGGSRAPTGAPSVAFSGVSFSYGAKSVLSGASFRIASAEHVALTGESGTGKTTLLMLLLGFAAQATGSIEIDGEPLSALDREKWRRCVAWLPQLPTIFHGTLGFNVRLGRPDASEADLFAALHLASVDEFLPRLPQGVETMIGEGARGLSVGQAQRVALARLFLRSPGLVLLDEPTAHLDDVSADLVSSGIESLCAGRTAILVTHKPRTVRTMDRTLVVRGGTVETGE